MELVVVFFITFILGLSILFEYGREYLKETTAEVFQPILLSLYSELTLLGFIGLLLFAIFKMDWVHKLSLRLFGEADAIQGIGEQVHMVLFLVMLLFLLQAVAMARFGETTQHKWHVWEAKPLLSSIDEANGYTAFRETYHAAIAKTTFCSHLCTRAEEKVRQFQHAAARLRFIEEADLHATADFDFARYLSVALGVQLGELVEVPVKTWFLLEVILLFFWRCELHLGDNARIALWVSTGCANAFAAFVVHAKIRLILHDYTALLVEEQHDCEVQPLIRKHSSLFWFGDKWLTFDCVRLISLLTSVYAAIFVLCYFDDLVLMSFDASNDSAAAVSWRKRGGTVGGVFIFLFACASPCVVVLKIRHILEDFAVAANVSDMKNRRYIEVVLRRQRTVNAFEALKVVQCLRHPEMLVQVSRQMAECVQPQADLPRHILLHSARRRASYRALRHMQTEEQSAYRMRQHRHWGRIFQLFDSDCKGTISEYEFRRLLGKFSNERITDDQIAAVLSTLDVDKSGEITLDEFISFADKLACFHREADPLALANDMFSLIDSDNSGTITVHEMHKVVAEYLGLDLSVEDVFSIIQDIDADGNGELDPYEFSVLLDRLGIYAY